MLIAAALLCASSEATLAQAAPPSPAETCLAANRHISLGVRLPRTAVGLKTGRAITVVAVGSSSTAGMGVSSSAAIYPEVMRQELARLRPNVQVEMVTTGRIGETIPGTIARFHRNVLAYRPDLVVWQLGTNDVLWGNRGDGLKNAIVQGVRMIKASGADVVLMDPQYAPRVLASPQHPAILATIAAVARQERANLFSRFALMRRSIATGLPSHNSAAGYDCVGRALARAVHVAAR